MVCRERGIVSENLVADPKKGFIALPMSVFELNLTPGAFRTLAELCRMANLEGQCWPSLAQLGKRLGRSRAAVSGYISELRDQELIETETQKMANGYNYRLRYRVVFWKQWRKELGQTVERSVKHVERPLETKNHNHINQSPREFGNLIDAWQNHIGRAPYPSFETWPTEQLLSATEAAVSQPIELISVDIIAAFESFLASNNIPTQDISQETRRYLASERFDEKRAGAFIAALQLTWKAHWAKPPTPDQLRRVLRTLPPTNGPQAEQKLLIAYLKRWKLQASHLSLERSATKVAA